MFRYTNEDHLHRNIETNIRDSKQRTLSSFQQIHPGLLTKRHQVCCRSPKKWRTHLGFRVVLKKRSPTFGVISCCIHKSSDMIHGMRQYFLDTRNLGPKNFPPTPHPTRSGLSTSPSIQRSSQKWRGLRCIFRGLRVESRTQRKTVAATSHVFFRQQTSQPS